MGVVATSGVTQSALVDDVVGELTGGMETIETDDEGTKRFLLGLHYVNRHCFGRKVTVNGVSGDITFDL